MAEDLEAVILGAKRPRRAAPKIKSTSEAIPEAEEPKK